MSIQLDSTYHWYQELTDGMEELAYRCEAIVYQAQSRFQKIDIVDTVIHGRMLFLDGIAQSSEADEFIYHEMLVHPALFSHPCPRKVLVIGGAEGATLREVFRHPSIERVVMVDIDGELVEACKTYLYNWHQGRFEDPRLQLVIGDGRKFLENGTEQFDVIIVDLSDPFPDSPAVFLFTKEFYELLRDRLTPNGCATLQGESISPQQSRLHGRMVNTLKAVFPVVRPYPYYLHSFHRPDAHILVSRDERWNQESLVRRLEEARLPLRYLSPEMAAGMFVLPPYLIDVYNNCDKIITDDQPGLEDIDELSQR